MPKTIFLDQNAWISLTQGASNREKFPRENAALVKIVECVASNEFIVPLTFANIYETSKINDRDRREKIALTQAHISGGKVFRSRRRIFKDTLARLLAEEHSIPYPEPEPLWFLSDLWFESAADYSPKSFGFEIPTEFIDYVRQEPERALLEHWLSHDDEHRRGSVTGFSAGSSELIERIERRRIAASDQNLSMRKRVYQTHLIIDEIDFILRTGRDLGLDWLSVNDVGSTLMRRISSELRVLRTEWELAVRLEDQSRSVNENDLRDMSSFIVALPLADVVIAEKQFVNLSRQAGLGKDFRTSLLTSVTEF